MVQSTHDVVIGEHEVVKRYRSRARGEPQREWAGLSLLHRLAPGLAPEPLRRRTQDGAPVIVMSRLPGKSLGSSPLTPDQVRGVGEVLLRMYTAVPAEELAGLVERDWGAAALVNELRSCSMTPPRAVSPLADSALTAASEWLNGPEAALLSDPPPDRVLTNADGNIGNFLWDGNRCYLVDFEDCGVSDPAFEIADLVEHVSVWLPGLLDVEALMPFLEFDADQRDRLVGYRRLMAVYWLLMLLPGSPGHTRNPEGSLERQAGRVHALLQ